MTDNEIVECAEHVIETCRAWPRERVSCGVEGLAAVPWYHGVSWCLRDSKGILFLERWDVRQIAGVPMVQKWRIPKSHWKAVSDFLKAVWAES